MMEDENNTVKELAESIVKMADALKTVQGFNRRLLILYIQDRTKLGKQKIEEVLNAVDAFIVEIEGEE
jgi:hypothetical protein